MTIDELMEGKKPGEIKVVEWGDFAQFYFVPYFKDRTGQWNGLIEGDCFLFYNIGFQFKVGDELNGFIAFLYCDDLEEGIKFFIAEAKKIKVQKK